MKECLKCGEKFPTTIVIDGKMRNLGSRKFCLQCSPFMCHNTKTIKSLCQDTSKKVCNKCKQEKDINDFYILSNGRRFSNCILCTRSISNNKAQEIKQKCIDYKGGKCEICGYDKYNGSLEFHHLDSSEKEFSIGQKHMRTLDILIPELDKCILVCKNCHGEIHGGVITV